MKKYIHYCWFGPKPLPKLAQKCIKSWKKYLPDYEMIKWSEDNFNINECPFVKGAYENKKYAFVADYVRAKVLKEYGGIYFDTDMKLIKNISHLLESETFLGVEDSGYIAAGVWYEKNKNAKIPTKLLEKYQSMKGFDINSISKYTIPILISKILGFKRGKINEIQHLEDGVDIYPRDYFYPYSYDWKDKMFTENTCMIHYYDATWIPKKERIETNMIRRIGIKNTNRVLNLYRKTKKIGSVLLSPILNYKRKKALITNDYLKLVDSSITYIDNNKNASYIAIHNGSFLGVTSATKELFEHTVDLREIYRKKDIKKIGKAIKKNNIKQVIFSSLSIGQDELIKYLSKNKIIVKVFWHGSNSQITDDYNWKMNRIIIELSKKKKIKTFGICKESLLEFYKKQNINTKFITNKVDVKIDKSEKKNDKKIRIGIYAANCDDWRKNMFTSLAAASLIENVVVDMVPLNDKAIEFAKIINLEIKGENRPLDRTSLITRMSQNDINLYVTYSECAPMLPLESLEQETICITGNNHHYFKNSELEKYLVINNENDPTLIKERIEMCLVDKEKIIKKYKEFSKRNKENSKKNIKDFLDD